MGKANTTASSGGFLVQRHENCDVVKTDQSETKRQGQNVEDDGVVSRVGDRVQVHVRGHVSLSLEFYDAHPPQFTYKFEMLNGGSHLPADERRQAVVQGVLLLFLALFGLMYVALIMNQLKSNGSIHLVGLFLGAAYVCQTVSVFFELLHVRKYEKDGMGYRFRYSWFPLDFLSEMFQGLSEYIIMFTLLCLASGWTFSTGSMMDGNSSGQESKEKEFFKGLKSPANVLRGKAFTAALFFGRCSKRYWCSSAKRENFNHHTLKHYDRYGTRGSDHVGVEGTYLRGRVQLLSRSRTLAWVRDHFFHSSTEIQHFLSTTILLDADAMLSLRYLCHGNLKNDQGKQLGKSDENISGISSFPRCDLVSVLSFHREYSMDVRSRESSHVSYGRFDSRSNLKSRCNALRLSLGEESVRQDLKCR